MSEIVLGALASVMDNDCLWFSNIYFNGLFKYDLHKREMSYVCSFGNDCGGIYLHNKAYVYKQFVIFCPLKDTKIRVYNKYNEQMVSYDIPELNSNIEFISPMLYKDIIYFGNGLGDVYTLDLKTFNIVLNRELTQICKKFIKENRSTLVIFRNGFICICVNNIHLYQIDVEDGVVLRMPKLLTGKGIVKDVYRVREEYWILYRDKCDIDIVSENSLKKTTIKMRDAWVRANKFLPFSSLYADQGDVWVLNYYHSQLNCVDKMNYNVKKSFIFQKDFRVNPTIDYGPVFSHAFRYEDYMVFVPCRGDCLILYNESLKKIENILFSIDSADINYLLCNELERIYTIEKGCVKENDIFSFKSYIEYLLMVDNIK